MAIDTIKLELSDTHAWALAQFVKRVGWSEILGCVANDGEAGDMREAINQFQDAMEIPRNAP